MYKYKSIENEDLQAILSKVKKEPTFFIKNEVDRIRLISEDEIYNYKSELMIEIDNIIPLIDIGNNDFIIYNCEIDKFQFMNIADDLIWRTLEENEIREYIEILNKKSKDF